MLDVSAAEKLAVEVPVLPKTYAFNPEKNVAVDMISFEKHRDVRPIDTVDRRHSLSERSLASASDGRDLINSFPIHECINDGKTGQKLCIHTRDSDQISPMAYNDISYSLAMQKAPNGSGDSKDCDRYDQRLNQPNIKPSISNVFNSLNEYINAPTRSLDYVEPVLDKVEDPPKMSVDSNVKKEFRASKAINEDTTGLKKKEITDTIDTITMADYADNLTMKLGAFLEIETGDARDNATIHAMPSIASQHSVLMRAEKDATSSVVQSFTSNVGVLRHERDDVAADAERSTSTEAAAGEKVTLNRSGALLEDTARTAVAEQNQLDSNMQEYPVTNKCLLVEDRESAFESDCNVINDESSNEERTRECYDVRETRTFDVTDDFSEKELNRYLLELEKEEEEEEEKAKLQSTSHADDAIGSSLSSVSDDARDAKAKPAGQRERDDEDTKEAPMLEKIMIGELPKISEEVFQEKAKKFPVMDYGTSAGNESANALAGRTDLRELNDTSSERSDRAQYAENNESSRAIKDNDVTGPVTSVSGDVSARRESTTRESQAAASIIFKERATSKHENVEEESNKSHGVLTTTQRLERDVRVDASQSRGTNDDVGKHFMESRSRNERIHCRDNTEGNEVDERTRDGGEAIPKAEDFGSKVADVSDVAQDDESGQEAEKPSRPQTLDIVSTHNKDSNVLGTISGSHPMQCAILLYFVA